MIYATSSFLIFNSSAWKEKLRAVAAAELSRADRRIAMSLVFELDVEHASGSQREQLQCQRCGEVTERLEAVRPAVYAFENASKGRVIIVVVVACWQTPQVRSGCMYLPVSL